MSSPSRNNGGESQPEWLREQQSSSSSSSVRTSHLESIGNVELPRTPARITEYTPFRPDRGTPAGDTRFFPPSSPTSSVSSLQGRDRSATTADGFDPVASFFRIFHVVSGCAALLCAAANVEDVLHLSEGLRGKIIHVYAALFSVMIVALELEIPFVVKRLKIFDLWVPRGLFYIFVGCLTIENSEDVDSVNLELWQNMGGVIVIFISLLYIVMVSKCF